MKSRIKLMILEVLCTLKKELCSVYFLVAFVRTRCASFIRKCFDVYTSLLPEDFPALLGCPLWIGKSS